MVSIVGDKGTGKSFLLDSVLSMDQDKITRGMSKYPKSIVTTSTNNYRTYTDKSVQFLDASGDVDFYTMMWLYYISNVMVFNTDQKERSDEKHFLKSLEKINDKLTIEDEAIDKPTLIIARRNF